MMDALVATQFSPKHRFNNDAMLGPSFIGAMSNHHVSVRLQVSSALPCMMRCAFTSEVVSARAGLQPGKPEPPHDNALSNAQQLRNRVCGESVIVKPDHVLNGNVFAREAATINTGVMQTLDDGW